MALKTNKEPMDPLEKTIVQRLRLLLHNNKVRIEDVPEWSTDEKVINDNLQHVEVKVPLPDLGVFCAVKKSVDKRPVMREIISD